MLFKTALNKELFTTSITTILILSGVVLAQRAVYIFRLAAKGIIPNDTIETVLVFNLLKHMPLLLSLTIFLSILITLTRWYRDNEMVAWFTAGMSLTKFIRPIIIFYLPIIILIGSLSLFISPWASQKAEEYKKNLKNRDEISTIVPGIFKETKSKDKVLYVEGLDDMAKSVKNIFIQTKNEKKIGVIVSNDGQRILNNDGSEYIILKNGKRYESNIQNNELSSTFFSEYGILIEKESSKIFKVSENQGPFEALPTFTLIQIAIADKNERNRYLSEVFLRASQPISAFILLFFSIAMSYVNNRVGRSINLIAALLLFIIYHNFMGIFQSLVATNKISIWLGFWPLHVFFIIIAILIINQRNNNQPLLKFKNA